MMMMMRILMMNCHCSTLDGACAFDVSSLLHSCKTKNK